MSITTGRHAEAMQITDNWTEVCDWVRAHAERVDPYYPAAYLPSGPDLDVCIVTPRGNLRANPGDWVIRHPDNSFHVCPDKDFEYLYAAHEDTA